MSQVLWRRTFRNSTSSQIQSVATRTPLTSPSLSSATGAYMNARMRTACMHHAVAKDSRSIDFEGEHSRQTSPGSECVRGRGGPDGQGLTEAPWDSLLQSHLRPTPTALTSEGALFFCRFVKQPSDGFKNTMNSWNFQAHGGRGRDWNHSGW